MEPCLPMGRRKPPATGRPMNPGAVTPDLYRTPRMWHSKYVQPIGEVSVGHHCRWSNPELDKIIDAMEKMGFDDPEGMDLAIDGLKILVAEMPLYSHLCLPRFCGLG